MSSEAQSNTGEDFSLVLGGPMYQFLLRVGLVRPPLARVGWRIVIITLLAWAPLAALVTLDGRLMTGVRIPFLYDFEVHCRLLVALPLFIASEVVVHRRIRMILSQFLQRRIIPDAELPRFDECIQSAMRLRNSTFLELGLVALVLAVGRLTWQGLSGVQSDTWYATVSGGGNALTPAGYWYMFFSVPVTQFIMLRWYFRIFVWSRMLWQLSRLNLNLVASHPDRHCGLGFLGGITFAMGPLLLAHSALVSGALANRILYAGTKLTDHGVEAAALAGFLFLLTFAPISAFAPVLMRKRLEGLRAYGALASEYVIDFETKWMSGRRPTGETLVGSSDIQSLADMNNSYTVVQQIRPFPFGRESLIGFAVFVALPLLPLLLTMFSMRELAIRLMNILL